MFFIKQYQVQYQVNYFSFQIYFLSVLISVNKLFEMSLNTDKYIIRTTLMYGMKLRIIEQCYTIALKILSAVVNAESS